VIICTTFHNCVYFLPLPQPLKSHHCSQLSVRKWVILELTMATCSGTHCALSIAIPFPKDSPENSPMAGTGDHRMVRVGRDLKDHLVPTPLP